jgi:hypothetical protein
MIRRNQDQEEQIPGVPEVPQEAPADGPEDDEPESVYDEYPYNLPLDFNQ